MNGVILCSDSALASDFHSFRSLDFHFSGSGVVSGGRIEIRKFVFWSPAIGLISFCNMRGNMANL